MNIKTKNGGTKWKSSIIFAMLENVHFNVKTSAIMKQNPDRLAPIIIESGTSTNAFNPPSMNNEKKLYE